MPYVSEGGKGFKATLNWTGFKEFENLLDEIEADFGEKDAKKILRNACRASMMPVLNAARSNLTINGNIDTGQLYASLQVEARVPTSKDKRSIYSTDSMVMIARVTVAPGHKFDPDKKLLSRTYKNRKTGQKEHMHSDARAFAIEFGTARWEPGSGRPFLRPALENNAQKVTDSLVESLRQALLKYQSKQMKTKR
jgi:hypothetical protein